MRMGGDEERMNECPDSFFVLSYHPSLLSFLYFCYLRRSALQSKRRVAEQCRVLLLEQGLLEVVVVVKVAASVVVVKVVDVFSFVHRRVVDVVRGAGALQPHGDEQVVLESRCRRWRRPLSDKRGERKTKSDDGKEGAKKNLRQRGVLPKGFTLPSLCQPRLYLFSLLFLLSVSFFFFDS